MGKGQMRGVEKGVSGRDFLTEISWGIGQGEGEQSVLLPFSLGLGRQEDF